MPDGRRACEQAGLNEKLGRVVNGCTGEVGNCLYAAGDRGYISKRL